MKIGVISTGGGGRIPEAASLSLKQLYDRVGYNTGNLAFWGGVARTLDDELEFLSWDFDPAAVRERCDLLLFPAANQLSSQVEMDFMADRFERADLPVIVVGLGSQAHSHDERIELRPGNVRWLSVMAERTSQIGVRGERSQEVLADHGITNSVVVGCPSLFINESENLGRLIHDRYVNGGERFVFCQGEMSGHSREQERILFDLAKRFEGSYICQAPDIVLALATGLTNDLTLGQLEAVRSYYAPDMALPSLLDFAEKRMGAYFDFEDWIEFLAQHDFSVGARLHGNFLALQAGVPAMVVCQDGRMSELTRTIGCPTLSREELKPDMTKLDFYRRFAFDPDAFDRNRSNLADRYARLLSSMGATARPALQRLAAKGSG